MTIDDISAEGKRLSAHTLPGMASLYSYAFEQFAINHFLDLITALEQARSELADADQEIKILKEELREVREANGQFGIGA